MTQTNHLPLWVQDRDTVIAETQDAQWRYGAAPVYDHTNEFLTQEKQYNHLEGSLEAIVQNLVRAFEMEATFKTNPQEWVTVVQEKFRMRTNGGQAYTVQDVIEQGTYNLFITENEAYNPKAEDFESSYHVFHNAFPKGFVWELIEVFSGPPVVTFKWRHWGTFLGDYKGHAPTGETIEVVGVSVARVSEDLKIESLEHYFDTNEFLNKLTQNKGNAIAAGESGCPFH